MGDLVLIDRTDRGGNSFETVKRVAGGVSDNLVEFYNGTNPQEVRVYGTFTDTSNYERFVIRTSVGTTFLSQEQAGTGAVRAVVVGTSGANHTIVRTNGTNRWRVDGTNGHLIAETDNAYDAGGPSNRIRSIYWGTQALGPGGSAGAPTYSFSGQTDSGMLYSSGLEFSVGGTVEWKVSGSLVRMSSDIGFGWTSTNATGTADLTLHRDAANTLAQRNGTNAQQFRSYNTFTDTSNYEFGIVGWSSNIFFLGTAKAGTGSTRAIRFQVGGTVAWDISTNTHLLAVTDNASDAGGPSNRIRSVYVGTHIEIGTTPAASGIIRLPNDSRLTWRNSGNTADVAAFFVGGDDAVYVGNNTASVILRPPDGGLRINNQTNRSGASTGTLGNAPGAVDPAFWMPISIAGTLHAFPCWTV